jgi:hypothetical protein
MLVWKGAGHAVGVTHRCDDDRGDRYVSIRSVGLFDGVTIDRSATPPEEAISG